MIWRYLSRSWFPLCSVSIVVPLRPRDLAFILGWKVHYSFRICSDLLFNFFCRSAASWYSPLKVYDIVLRPLWRPFLVICGWKLHYSLSFSSFYWILRPSCNRAFSARCKRPLSTEGSRLEDWSFFDWGDSYGLKVAPSVSFAFNCCFISFIFSDFRCCIYSPLWYNRTPGVSPVGIVLVRVCLGLGERSFCFDSDSWPVD